MLGWGIVLLLFFLAVSPVQALVINEFVPDGSPEWVEFFNASDSAEFIKNYYLDDDESFDEDSGSKPKKLLTDLVISNPSYPYIEISSMLNNNGDWVVIFDSEGVLVDKYNYHESVGENVSQGRSPDGSGEFTFLSSSTKGLANSGPIPTSTPKPATPTPAPTSQPSSTPVPTKPPTSNPTPKPKPTSTIIPEPTLFYPDLIITDYPLPQESVLGTTAEPSYIPLPTTYNQQPNTATTTPPWPAAVLIATGSAGILGSIAFFFFRRP